MSFTVGVNVWRLAEQRRALERAKSSLPPSQYAEVKAAYDKLWKYTLLFIVVCIIPIVVISVCIMCGAPFSKSVEESTRPKEATGYVTARVDYDGNFWWTFDSSVYEHSLEDYGLSAEDYEFGDSFKVYTDDNQNVIKIDVEDKSGKTREIEAYIGVIGGFVIPVLLIVCIYYPIARRTFGKKWYDFYRGRRII